MSIKGMSLLEVLLAISLMAFVIGGLMTYQLKIIQYAKAAYMQSLAINQLRESAWEIDHHVSFLKNQFLPNLDIQLTDQELEVIWQGPINTWNCAIFLTPNFSCLGIKIGG